MTNLFATIALILFSLNVSSTQWIQANGAGSGRPICVAISGTSLIAGTEFGGVIQSTSAGDHWATVHSIPADIPIYSITSNNRDVYAGTYNGVFWSSNNGTSWTEINNGLPESRVTKLAILNPYVFAATPDSGVFRSAIGSTYWIPVRRDSTPFYVQSLGVAGPYIYLCNYDSVYRSSDLGTHWIALARLEASCIASDSTYLFAGSHLGAYRSSDFGVSWVAITAGLMDMRVTAIAANDNILIVGTDGNGLFASTDQGSSWNRVLIGSSDSSITVISVAVNDTFSLVGTEHGVFASLDNGLTWSNGNANLANRFVCSIASHGTNMFAGVNGGVYRSSDLGQGWTPVLTKGDKYIGDRYTTLFVDGEDVYAGNNDGDMFRTSDDGLHWTILQNKWTKYTCFAASDGNLFAGTEFDGVLRLSPTDSDWVRANDGLASLKVSGLDALGSNLFVVTDQALYQSFNNATHWVPVAKFADALVSGVMACGTFLFAETLDDSLFFSADTGRHWASVTGGLPSLRISAFAASGLNTFVAPYYGGIFLSTDSCMSWHSVNEGLLPPNIWSLGVHNDQLLAGSGGNGVWRRSLPEMVTGIERPIESIAAGCHLFQNFPNPFNPFTIINYQLSGNTDVLLRVFDLLGREVTTLINRRENAGFHSFTFDASILPSGIYFYRLQAGSYANTKKLVLLR